MAKSNGELKTSSHLSTRRTVMKSAEIKLGTDKHCSCTTPTLKMNERRLSCLECMAWRHSVCVAVDTRVKDEVDGDAVVKLRSCSQCLVKEKQSRSLRRARKPESDENCDICPVCDSECSCDALDVKRRRKNSGLLSKSPQRSVKMKLRRATSLVPFSPPKRSLALVETVVGGACANFTSIGAHPHSDDFSHKSSVLPMKSSVNLPPSANDQKTKFSTRNEDTRDILPTTNCSSQPTSPSQPKLSSSNESDDESNRDDSSAISSSSSITYNSLFDERQQRFLPAHMFPLSSIDSVNGIWTEDGDDAYENEKGSDASTIFSSSSSCHGEQHHVSDQRNPPPLDQPRRRKATCKRTTSKLLNSSPALSGLALKNGDGGKAHPIVGAMTMDAKCHKSMRPSSLLIGSIKAPSNEESFVAHTAPSTATKALKIVAPSFHKADVTENAEVKSESSSFISDSKNSQTLLAQLPPFPNAAAASLSPQIIQAYLAARGISISPAYATQLAANMVAPPKPPATASAPTNHNGLVSSSSTATSTTKPPTNVSSTNSSASESQEFGTAEQLQHRRRDQNPFQFTKEAKQMEALHAQAVGGMQQTWSNANSSTTLAPPNSTSSTSSTSSTTNLASILTPISSVHGHPIPQINAKNRPPKKSNGVPLTFSHSNHHATTAKIPLTPLHHVTMPTSILAANVAIQSQPSMPNTVPMEPHHHPSTTAIHQPPFNAKPPTTSASQSQASNMQAQHDLDANCDEFSNTMMYFDGLDVVEEVVVAMENSVAAKSAKISSHPKKATLTSGAESVASSTPSRTSAATLTNANRFDRVPIGTFRRSRRISAPLLKLSSAVKSTFGVVPHTIHETLVGHASKPSLFPTCTVLVEGGNVTEECSCSECDDFFHLSVDATSSPHAAATHHTHHHAHNVAHLPLRYLQALIDDPSNPPSICTSPAVNPFFVSPMVGPNFHLDVDHLELGPAATASLATESLDLLTSFISATTATSPPSLAINNLSTTTTVPASTPFTVYSRGRRPSLVIGSHLSVQRLFDDLF